MRYLLTGGAACGKSAYGEQICVASPLTHSYIATMMPYGEESLRKIDRHRAMRSAKGFATIERYTNLAGVALPQRGTALLECLCNLLANEMFDATRSCDDCADLEEELPPGFPHNVDARAAKAVLDGVMRLEAQCDILVVITNDVGGDGGGYDLMTTCYVDTLGYLNRQLAARFERVYELVCGIPILLKGE
ncbi:MAG: bifunctional adenosylcobinamide kinase/adenosylcobinamide-phosphate guanylyltransferase [Clostridia bacterium]